jgi:nucleoside-diphosphate-sugar epimerase
MTAKPLRVLVTGSDGYIGSVLMPMLQAAGMDAVGLDVGWYKEGHLVPLESTWQTIVKDVRQLEKADLEGFDAVVHLAALSNDPVGELDRDLTIDINYKATVRLAELARAAGAKRFVFMSSCSMYGRTGEKPLDESATFAPQTAYAESKVLAERDLQKLATEQFSPVYLRNATAYGVSPRQRFDIVVPNLSGFAYTTGEVKLQSDGTPWRPLVHIRDINVAIIAALRAPRDVIHNEAFNIGSNRDNYQIKQIAEAVQLGFPESKITLSSKPTPDTRSYRVDFSKATKSLVGYAPTWNLEKGVGECAQTYKKIGLTKEQFESRLYTRLRQIKHLLESGSLDEKLYWRAK